MRTFSLLLVLSSLAFQGCHKSEEIFLFSFFQDNGKDGLHLAYSEDGYQWKTLNGNQSFLKPIVGEDRLMRDPCIIQGPAGRFHMVWTVSWQERGIGYAWSDDLVNWSTQQYIPVMEQEAQAQNCWAPELFYDKQIDRYLIYWSTTIADKFPETAHKAEEDWNHRIYYCTTKDFETFSETKLLLDPGFNVIDAVITKADDQYIMVVKNETKFPEAQKNLHIFVSDQLTQGYHHLTGPVSGHWVEGPTITKIGDQWVIYFDRYRNHKMGAIVSNDLIRWADISDQVEFPEGTRHGTVFRVKKSLAKHLVK